MSKAFYFLILISIVGITYSTLLLNNEWITLGVGLTGVILYFSKLYNQKMITNSEVDSVYYFGFLVTLVTLLATAISIGLKPEDSISLRKVLVQFGLGLSATGFALLFRIMLLSKSQIANEQNIAEAFEKMVEAINSTIRKFDDAAVYTDAFIKKRTEDLEKIHTEFNSKLVDTYKSFDNYLKDIYDKTSRNLNQMQNNIIKGMYDSIQKQNELLEDAIKSICKTIEKLEQDMGKVNFESILSSITDFTEHVKLNITNISDHYKQFNQDTKNTLDELMKINKSLSSFTGTITKKINKLEPLHKIVESFNDFNTTVSNTIKNLKDAATSIKEFGNTFDSFSNLNDLKNNLHEEIINVIDSLKKLPLCLSIDNADSFLQNFKRYDYLITESSSLITSNLDKLKVLSDKIINNLTKINDSMDNISNLILYLPEKAENQFNEIQDILKKLEGLNFAIKSFTSVIIRNKNDFEIALISLTDVFNSLSKNIQKINTVEDK